jgi:hypothetical protein
MDLTPYTTDAINYWVKLNGKIHSVNTVKIWMDKYRSIYQQIKKAHESFKKSSFILPNGSKIPRTRMEMFPEVYFNFLSFYEELEKIYNYQQYEGYFNKELEHYAAIKDSQEQVEKWLRKNMYLGNNKFLLFAIEYTDFEGNEKFAEEECPLKPFFSFISDLDLYIHREDFKHVFEFIELFHTLFYDKKLLPSSLERIQSDFIEFKRFRLN